MQVHLKQAQPGQIHLLEPLVAAYHEFECIDSNATRRNAALRQLLRDPRLGAVWLIEVDEQLAGYIALCRGFSIEFNGFDAFIDEFFLSPPFRGRGVGKRVLAQIAKEARRFEINAVHLEVARDNQPARRLYDSAGFRARDKYLLMSMDLLSADGDGP